MFPEGDVTGRDDVISPLKKDGIRNIFEAQEKSLKIDPQRAVHVIPTAIYYQVHEDAWQPLKELLGQAGRLSGTYRRQWTNGKSHPARH